MILVLRAPGVGGLATGVPALRALRRAFPGERLVLWGPPPDRAQHVAIWRGRTAEPGDTAGDVPHPALPAVTAAEVTAAALRIGAAPVPGAP